MNVPIVWVMGGPGSGKSTLSQNIVNKYGYKHLDPNEIMDREIEAKTEMGEELSKKRQKGDEVSLADITNLIDQEIVGSQDGLRGFVIDGYPQNQGDANILEERIGVPDLIISLQVAQETSRTRNSARGSIVSSTVSFFTINTAPVLQKYSKKLKLVDGERDPKAIFDDIVPNLDTINKNQDSPNTSEH